MNGPRRRTGLFLVLAALTAALFVRLGLWQLLPVSFTAAATISLGVRLRA